MKELKYYVYILCNRQFGAFYVGVTNSLVRRIYEHKLGLIDGHSKKYNINQFVYYEIYGDIAKALHREKQLKRWHRDWKIELIEKENSNWDDLYGLLN